MIQSVNPPEVWSPFGAFSMAVIQGEGQVVHLKGQVALDREVGSWARPICALRCRKALENIQTVLGAMGGSTADVLSLTHYVTDIDAFMTAGDIRRQFFAEPYPVTTTVQVVRLYHPDLLVEITATAEIPRDRFRAPGAVREERHPARHQGGS